jgi:hypothetical protein
MAHYCSLLTVLAGSTLHEIPTKPIHELKKYTYMPRQARYVV